MNFMLMMNSYLYKFKTFSPAHWLESNWIDVNFFSFCGSISDSQKIYIFTCIFFVWKDGVSKVSCWAMLIEISSLHLTRPPWGCSPWRCPHRPLLRWSFCPAYNCNLRGVLALELSLITSLAEQKRWEVQSIYQQPKWSHSFFWGLLIVFKSKYLSCL